MAGIFNEGKACDAALLYLEERDRTKRRDLRFPENEGHDHPIELSCVLGNLLVAFEHTGIEPFPNHIRNGAQTRAFIAPVVERLLKTLPATEFYKLALPIDAVQQLNRLEAPLIQERLINWIEDIASKQPLFNSSEAEFTLNHVSIPGVPFRVWLTHEGNVPAINPVFVCGLVIPDRSNKEDERAERIRAGYAKKMKKLAAWKREYDAHTILILENADISFTRADLVAKAVFKIVNDASEKPDEILLVTTCLRRWRVFPILRDSTFFDHMDVKPQWIVDGDTLQSLTGR